MIGLTNMILKMSIMHYRKGNSNEMSYFEDASGSVPVECHFFNKGFCRKAGACPFLHIEKAAPIPKKKEPSSDAVIPRTPCDKSTILCAFFLRGKCRTKNCSFLHQLPEVEYSKNSHSVDVSRGCEESLVDVVGLDMVCSCSKFFS